MCESRANGVGWHVHDPDFLLGRGVPRDNQHLPFGHPDEFSEKYDQRLVGLTLLGGGCDGNLRLSVEFAEVAGSRGTGDDFDT